jgi:hypothetical protein
VLQLLVSLGAVVLMSPPTEAPARPEADGGAVVGGAVRAAPAAPEPDPRVLREQAVRTLLDTRAAAVRNRDREGFLAGVAGPPEFVERQAALFDNLENVPLAVWEYELDGRTDRAPNADLDARYGPDQWWAPDVVLKYAIAEFDPEPTYAPQRLTFVRVGEAWRVASDDDFEAAGLATTRALWDSGPVVTHRGVRSLALGHPGSEPLMKQIADVVDDAVPRVSSVWGTEWTQTVVILVPRDQEELDRLLGGTTDLTRIAAVATAELTDLQDGYHPVGNRVLVNPPNFAKLGRLGRQVVLTHETAHVATRKATGPDAPAWMVEGLADYIGYLDVPVPLTTAARETYAAVQEGRIPQELPADSAFDGANPDLPLAYETSWLAFRLLVDTYGLEAALRCYRSVGVSRGVGSAVALERAFAEELGTTVPAFTAAWREHLASAFS